jgi:hypothetical protein
MLWYVTCRLLPPFCNWERFLLWELHCEIFPG